MVTMGQLRYAYEYAMIKIQPFKARMESNLEAFGRRMMPDVAFDDARPELRRLTVESSLLRETLQEIDPTLTPFGYRTYMAYKGSGRIGFLDRMDNLIQETEPDKAFFGIKDAGDMAKYEQVQQSYDVKIAGLNEYDACKASGQEPPDGSEKYEALYTAADAQLLDFASMAGSFNKMGGLQKDGKAVDMAEAMQKWPDAYTACMKFVRGQTGMGGLDCSQVTVPVDAAPYDREAMADSLVTSMTPPSGSDCSIQY